MTTNNAGKGLPGDLRDLKPVSCAFRKFALGGHRMLFSAVN